MKIVKKIIVLLASIAIGLWFIQCASDAPNKPVISETREKFHTIFSIRIFKPYPEKVDLKKIVNKCWEIADSIEQASNFYDTTSTLSRINRGLHSTGKAVVPGQILPEMIGRSLQIGKSIDFGLDPSIGRISILWPFGEPDPVPPDKNVIERVLAKVNAKKIQLKDSILMGCKGQILDLSSVNKGYAVDRIVKFLRDHGITNALVDAGGNLGIIWNRPDSVLISIRHPEEPGQIIMHFLYRGNGGIATSGNYMNVFEYKGHRYHHILDPKTGFPSDSASSLTVIADDAMTADGLATGLFVKGKHYAMNWQRKHPHIQFIWIRTEDHTIYLPMDFPYPIVREESDYEIVYEKPGPI